MGAAVCCVEEDAKDNEVADSSPTFDDAGDMGKPRSWVLSTDEHLPLDLPAVHDVNWTPPKLDLSTDDHPAMRLAVEALPREGETQKQHVKPFVEEVLQERQAQFLEERREVHEFEEQRTITEFSHHASEKRHSGKEGNVNIEHELPATIMSEDVKTTSDKRRKSSGERARPILPSGDVGIKEAESTVKGNIELPATITSEDKKTTPRKRRKSSKEKVKPILPSGAVGTEEAESTVKVKRRQNKKRTEHLSKDTIKHTVASEAKPDVHSTVSEGDSKREVPLDTVVAKQLSLDKQWLNAEDAKEERLRPESGNHSPVSPGGRRSIRTCTNSVLRTVVRNLDAHAKEALCRAACAQYLASGAILYGRPEENNDLCAMGFHAFGKEATSFAANSSRICFVAGTPDGPSRALASQKLDFMSEACSEEAAVFRRKNLAMKHGVKSICCVPYGDGVLEIFSTTGWSESPDVNVVELRPLD